MRRMLPAPAVATAAILLLTLTGCGEDSPTPEPTETELWAGVGEDSTDSTDTEAPAGGGSVAEGEVIPVPPGMPAVDLIGCDTLEDYSVNETEFDTQWVWKFECRSVDPFTKTVESINARSEWTQTMSISSGNESYLGENYHYISEVGGKVADVDLAAKGKPEKARITYKITLSKS